MPDSIRKQIMAQVGVRLADITIANGYITDLGQRVSYFRDLPVEYQADELTYRDSSEESQEVGSKHHQMLMVELEAIASTTTPGETANDMLADLQRLTGLNRNWGGLAIITHLRGNETEAETDGQQVVRVQQMIEIQYRTNRFDPFTH